MDAATLIQVWNGVQDIDILSKDDLESAILQYPYFYPLYAIQAKRFQKDKNWDALAECFPKAVMTAPDKVELLQFIHHHPHFWEGTDEHTKEDIPGFIHSLTGLQQDSFTLPVWPPSVDETFEITHDPTLSHSSNAQPEEIATESQHESAATDEPDLTTEDAFAPSEDARNEASEVGASLLTQDSTKINAEVHPKEATALLDTLHSNAASLDEEELDVPKEIRIAHAEVDGESDLEHHKENRKKSGKKSKKKQEKSAPQQRTFTEWLHEIQKKKKGTIKSNDHELPSDHDGTKDTPDSEENLSEVVASGQFEAQWTRSLPADSGDLKTVIDLVKSIQQWGDTPPTEISQEEEAQLQAKAKKSISLETPIATEVMATIFEKQGKWDQAITVYEQLILKNPLKTTYFASRIAKIKELRGL